MKPVAWYLGERGMSVDELVAASRLDAKVVKALVSGKYTASPVQRARVAGALGVAVEEISWEHGVEVQHLRGNGPQVGRST